MRIMSLALTSSSNGRKAMSDGEKVHRNARGWRIGESHPKAYLTDEQVEAMRVMRDEGATYKQIAEAFDCPFGTARDIADYRTRI